MIFPPRIDGRSANDAKEVLALVVGLAALSVLGATARSFLGSASANSVLYFVSPVLIGAAATGGLVVAKIDGRIPFLFWAGLLAAGAFFFLSEWTPTGLAGVALCFSISAASLWRAAFAR